MTKPASWPAFGLFSEGVLGEEVGMVEKVLLRAH